MRPIWISRFRRWAITVGIIAGATLLQRLCWSLVQPEIFLFYFPAVLLASIYGSGILAGWLSIFVAEWYFAPTMKLVGASGPVIRALVFLGSAYTIHSIRAARSAALARLIEGQAQLKAAVRSRDEFISIASHELKTPITSLKLQFQMAARQIAAGDIRVFMEGAVHKRIDSVNRQLDRMTRLIEDMLDVSRVATGKLHLDKRRFDLSEFVREICDRFVEQMKAVGSTLELEIKGGIFFFGDEYRLEQVISNLLTNALKYGGGHSVRVRLSEQGGRIHFSVKDAGIGIAEKDRARVFERFERAVSADNVSGLGLGLYISKQIVEALGGTVALESQIGKGSTFTVELPRENASG